ncbi:bifunctional autolysin precursor [Desulfosporosinus acididurans]|uniref:Bifunctional autolysin n=1 Tax=Desulfosporosinus acididurans TaxID=476652 RepID=A0A0J1FRW8_9FIRM|nr:N-acetylmuramoyl-L-alanine amidase [Desulfosporosinus acididurans]KLU65743.1 bifunctional autolysin precursor [Desulfosporosinus acididurans]
MSYPIEQNFIPGLPKEPYNDGVGNYVGVIGHSTANNGDSADGERNYEVTTWQNAFVHAFVDDRKILQVADFNYLCYGAGHSANHLGYVQVELCQTTDPVKFQAAYEKYVWLLAKLLYNRKLSVVDGITLMSHAQVSAKWHETTHQDPIEYLASHGKTWADLVADVTAQYKLMEEEDSVLNVAVLLFTKDDFWSGNDVAVKNGNCALFIRTANQSVPAEAKSAKQLIVVGGPSTGHPNEVLLSGKDKYATAAAVAKYLGQ